MTDAMNQITLTVNGDPALDISPSDACDATDLMAAADYDPRVHELYPSTADILNDDPVETADPNVATAYIAIRTAETTPDAPYGVTD